MGLTSWSDEKPRKIDVVIAKNYLQTEEIEALNRIVTAYSPVLVAIVLGACIPSFFRNAWAYANCYPMHTACHCPSSFMHQSVKTP